MKSNDAPPWGKRSTWREANHSMDDLIRRYSGKLSSTVTLAFAVRDRLESIFDLLDALGIETCSRCPDPCCLNASPWFD